MHRRKEKWTWRQGSRNSTEKQRKSERKSKADQEGHLGQYQMADIHVIGVQKKTRERVGPKIKKEEEKWVIVQNWWKTLAHRF